MCSRRTGARRRGPRTGLAFCSFCAAACTAPGLPDPAPVVWAGQNIEVATNVEDTSCGGTREYLDAFVGALADELDLELSGERVRYYLLDPEELEEVCDPHERCTFATRLYTEHAMDTHEIVHATRNAALGEKPGISYFEEGLAMMYGFPEPLAVYLEVDPAKDVYAGIESLPSLRGVLPPEHYGVAGDFTRFLEVTFGIETVSSFIDDQSGIESVDALEALFADHVGQDLQAAVEIYQTDYPACSHFARTRHLIECAQSPVQPSEGGFRVDFDLSCDAPDVLGPMEGMMWKTFTFDVTTAGTYSISNSSMPFDFVAEVVDCTRGCSTSIDFRADDEASIFRSADLDPGRYLVRLSRSVESPGQASLTVTGFE